MAIKKTIMINDGRVKIKKVFVFINKFTPAHNSIYYYETGVNRKYLFIANPFLLLKLYNLLQSFQE